MRRFCKIWLPLEVNQLRIKRNTIITGKLDFPTKKYYLYKKRVYGKKLLVSTGHQPQYMDFL